MVELTWIDYDLAGVQISQSENAFAAELLVAHFDGGAGLHSPSIVAPSGAQKSGPALGPLWARWDSMGCAGVLWR